MDQELPILTIKLEGENITPSRINAILLRDLLENMTRILIKTNQLTKITKEAIDLEFVLLTHGSPSVVLGFDFHEPQEVLFAKKEENIKVLEKALISLDHFQSKDDSEIKDIEYQLMKDWNEFDKFLKKGVSQVTFNLNHKPSPLTTCISKISIVNMQNKLKLPIKDVKSVEGQLIMADFSINALKCKIIPFSGNPITCVFTEDQRDEIYENLRHHVRIWGEGENDPITKIFNKIKIEKIESLDKKDQGYFWDNPSIDDLAKFHEANLDQQTKSLYCHIWPENEPIDDFITTIDLWRKEELVRE